MESPEEKGGLLRLLCLHNAEAARATLGWVLPYLLLCILSLGLMSYGFHQLGLVQIPVVGYVVAVLLAAVCVFFTLALIRGLALRNSGGE